uniref:Nucleotide-diphospho-sugar transferase domain-containing protein n=1 Tax=Araucaria cunninghamii TaxID=56994 RepID=A0A0D6QZ75_ARACU
MQESSKMKPVFIAIQISVVVGTLITMIYLGKPVYWEIMARTRDQVNQTFYSSRAYTEENSAFLNSSMPAPSGIKKPSVRSVWKKPIWQTPAVGSKMPSSKSFILTKEMIGYRAKDNVIIVTFGNYAFMDFIVTWVKHLTDLGVSNILVGGMDAKVVKALYWKGIPVFDMGSKMKTIDVGWGSPTFHKMGREKVYLINVFMSLGYELLMCDTDMVWLKDPLPYFSRFPAADILTSSDQLVPTVVDDRLEAWEKVTGAFNIGIFYWRSSNLTRRFAKEWHEMLIADDKIWDQNGFNDLMHRKFGPSVDTESGLVYAFDGTLKLGILPASIFCSGHTYFVQAQPAQLGLDPYAVHTTFQYAGTDGKRHRLREAMIFYDSPEYYDSKGGFLSFNSSIPEELLTGGEHSVDSHFALVNYQIKQIRSALAIANILNRILVMPPLWCRLDRLWYGHPGILPGTITKQPFLCPLDHVFEVNVMLSLEGAEFGPTIGFREYSFLKNSRVPKQVKESKLKVELCDEETDGCIMKTNREQTEVLRLPRNKLENEIKAALSAYKDVKVLEFSSMENAFGGFSDKDKEIKFRNRVKRYVGIWCCVEGLQVGHIWYDMYWDEKPGWKPRPPATPQDNHPNW